MALLGSTPPTSQATADQLDKADGELLAKLSKRAAGRLRVLHVKAREPLVNSFQLGVGFRSGTYFLHAAWYFLFAQFDVLAVVLQEQPLLEEVSFAGLRRITIE
jgi:hypothetical protein